jgi:hypothetical protein
VTAHNLSLLIKDGEPPLKSESDTLHHYDIGFMVDRDMKNLNEPILLEVVDERIPLPETPQEGSVSLEGLPQPVSGNMGSKSASKDVSRDGKKIGVQWDLSILLTDVKNGTKGRLNCTLHIPLERRRGE